MCVRPWYSTCICESDVFGTSQDNLYGNTAKINTFGKLCLANDKIKMQTKHIEYIHYDTTDSKESTTIFFSFIFVVVSVFIYFCIELNGLWFDILLTK